MKHLFLLTPLCLPGRSVAEIHVGGVRANFTKRLYDMSLSFTVHSLLVADAMQMFGPDYDLLIASHKNIWYVVMVVLYPARASIY